MKIALAADTQFDDYSSLSTLLPSGITSRLQDQIDALLWVAQDAKLRGCEKLFTLGDVFDSRTTLDLSVIDSVCRAYYRIKTDFKLDLSFLVGNHDAYLRSSALNSLQVFRGYADVYDQPTAVGPFAFLPWADSLDAVRAGVAALSAVKSAQYLFMHGIIHGSVHKSVAGIPLDVVQPSRWKRVFLGDVHEPSDPAQNVHYVGSFMQLQFGDAGGFRGYVVLDTATGKFERVQNAVSPRFHILRADKMSAEAIGPRDFVSVEVDDPSVVRDVVEKLRSKGCWVRAPAVEEVASAPPRLDVRASHDYHDVIHRFCAYHNVDDPDLESLGVELLEAAKGAI